MLMYQYNLHLKQQYMDNNVPHIDVYHHDLLIHNDIALIQSQVLHQLLNQYNFVVQVQYHMYGDCDILVENYIQKHYNKVWTTDLEKKIFTARHFATIVTSQNFSVVLLWKKEKATENLP